LNVDVGCWRGRWIWCS